MVSRRVKVLKTPYSAYQRAHTDEFDEELWAFPTGQGFRNNALARVGAVVGARQRGRRAVLAGPPHLAAALAHVADAVAGAVGHARGASLADIAAPVATAGEQGERPPRHPP